MSLPLPVLDDRNWQDLRDEGVSLIPRHAPEWTNHNPSDPGITLVELLAYQTEAELFRIDQIGDSHLRAFLRALGDGLLPAGPKPAATLLVYEPQANVFPKRPVIDAGTCFVPRQPPTRGRAAPEPIPKPTRPRALRNTEPADALLYPDSTPEESDVPEYGFRAAHDLTLTRIRIVTVQSFDGKNYRDRSDMLGGRRAAPVWGEDPGGPDAAMYVGLDLRLMNARALAVNRDWALTLWAVPEGFEASDLSRTDGDTFQPRECPHAPPGAGEFVDRPEAAFQPFNPELVATKHHGVRVRWEYRTDAGWLPVPRAGFRDDTRAFTRPGRIVIPGSVFESPARTVVGGVPVRHFSLRCRIVEGRPDVAPRLSGLYADAVLAEQWDDARTETSVPKPAKLGDLRLPEAPVAALDSATADLVSRGWERSVASWTQYPLNELKEFDELQSTAAGIRAFVIGVGSGEPFQKFDLPAPDTRTNFAPRTPDDDDAPPIQIMTDTLSIWTLEPPWAWSPKPLAAPKKWQAKKWALVPDLGPGPRHLGEFRYVPAPNGSRSAPPGYVLFGDGESGRVPPPGSVVFASYSWTLADEANFAAGYLWEHESDREKDPKPRASASQKPRFRNVLPACGGDAPEELTAAVDRLTAEFDSSERLVNAARDNSLDGIDLGDFAAPPMAATMTDLECLARKTPGAVVARARAWAEVDPRFPGVAAPGAATVVILPELPAERPMPTAELLFRVRAHLNEHRPLACRIAVSGPKYQPVRVTATLTTIMPKIESVRLAANAALAGYLHPLRGGEAGSGWPFGQDVYPGALMKLFASLADVLHVTGLRVAAGTGDWTEAPAAIPAMALPALTAFHLTVKGDG